MMGDHRALLEIEETHTQLLNYINENTEVKALLRVNDIN
jgi:hypothetical protein